jgi:hypothetical protein
MTASLRTVRGVAGRGARPGDSRGGEIRGSTTIVEILRMYPGGEAAALMARLHWPCAHCGGAFNEPLTMAATRHRNSPRAALEAFRALATGGPNEEQVERAAEKQRRLAS